MEGGVGAYCRTLLRKIGTYHSAKNQGSPEFRAMYTFSEEAIEEIAGIVTAYHAWRHTPRSERGKDWPKDLDGFCEKLGKPVERVLEAVYQARYHRWEERYVPKVSREARVSQIKDSLLHNVLRQDSVEDASKVNANLYRTALQAEGAIEGTKKVTQVNIGSNVINMPENMTKEMLMERADRLQRLTRKLNAREVSHVEVADPVGEGEGGTEGEVGR